jgi:signal transduction histidine kinase
VFKTLYGRLALVLIVLVVGLSGSYLWITLRAAEAFYQETLQLLNRRLAGDLTQVASNLIDETGLNIADERYDEAALDHVFHTYMVVNPSIEVYLLDPAGRILAYHAPPGTVKQERIDLAPVRTFIRDEQQFPIFGDDPRHPGRKDVFSAAPIGPADEPEGYLYVVLAGEQMQAVVDELQASRIPRLTVSAVVIATLFALAAGLLLLRYLTRRLHQLTRDMQAFEASGFSAPVPDMGEPVTSDQIGHLQRTFAAMAQRIQAQIRLLQKTDDLRRELVANVSHDLRTPLAALQAITETLLIKDATLSDTERRDYLKRSLRQWQSLSKLVDSLFELAKLDAGQVKVKKERFALSELVQDVTHKHALTAQRKRIRLATHLPQQLPLVDADIGLIERVLDNLMDNALRNTPQGGLIDLRLSLRDSAVDITVTDTGPGIAAQDLPYVFDRYYQSRDGAASTSGSAGLGLAISRRILELHQSRLRVDNAPGAGAQVQFSLPVSGPPSSDSRAA